MTETQAQPNELEKSVARIERFLIGDRLANEPGLVQQFETQLSEHTQHISNLGKKLDEVADHIEESNKCRQEQVEKCNEEFGDLKKKSKPSKRVKSNARLLWLPWPLF